MYRTDVRRVPKEFFNRKHVKIPPQLIDVATILRPSVWCPEITTRSQLGGPEEFARPIDADEVIDLQNETPTNHRTQ